METKIFHPQAQISTINHKWLMLETEFLQGKGSFAALIKILEEETKNDNYNFII